MLHRLQAAYMERALQAKGLGPSRQEDRGESEEGPQLLLEWIPYCSHPQERKAGGWDNIAYE